MRELRESADEKSLYALRQAWFGLGRRGSGAHRCAACPFASSRPRRGNATTPSRNCCGQPARTDPDAGAGRWQRAVRKRRNPHPSRPGAIRTAACCHAMRRRARRRCADWCSSPRTAMPRSASSIFRSAGAPTPTTTTRSRIASAPARGRACIAIGRCSPTCSRRALAWRRRLGALDLHAAVVSKWSGARKHLAAAAADVLCDAATHRRASEGRAQCSPITGRPQIGASIAPARAIRPAIRRAQCGLGRNDGRAPAPVLPVVYNARVACRAFAHARAVEPNAMRILLSNDDGYFAPGLERLAADARAARRDHRRRARARPQRRLEFADARPAADGAARAQRLPVRQRHADRLRAPRGDRAARRTCPTW